MNTGSEEKSKCFQRPPQHVLAAQYTYLLPRHPFSHLLCSAALFSLLIFDLSRFASTQAFAFVHSTWNPSSESPGLLLPLLSGFHSNVTFSGRAVCSCNLIHLPSLSLSLVCFSLHDCVFHLLSFSLLPSTHPQTSVSQG